METSQDHEETPNWREIASALIKRQKTMVLATSKDDHPWAAPVYYVFFSPGFYFFSSPRSLHIQHILTCDNAAVSIHADGDRLEQLEGLQMSGRVQRIDKPLLALSVTARYLLKFPMARPLLSGINTAGPDLRTKVSLYAFIPERLFYMNHQMGFGSRTPIDLISSTHNGDQK